MGNGKRDGDASTDVRPSHFPHCQSSLTIACIQRQASSRHFYRGGTSPIEHVTTYSGVTWRKSFAFDAPVCDSAPRCNESPGRARGNSTLPLNGGHRVTGLLRRIDLCGLIGQRSTEKETWTDSEVCGLWWRPRFQVGAHQTPRPPPVEQFVVLRNQKGVNSNDLSVSNNDMLRLHQQPTILTLRNPCTSLAAAAALLGLIKFPDIAQMSKRKHGPSLPPASLVHNYYVHTT